MSDGTDRLVGIGQCLPDPGPVVAAEVDVHQAGDFVAGIGVLVVVDALDEGVGAVAEEVTCGRRRWRGLSRQCPGIRFTITWKSVTGEIVGQVAADLLISLLSNGAVSPPVIRRFSPHLTIRESTGPAPSAQ